MAANNMTLGERWRVWTGTNADHYVSLTTLLQVMNQFDRVMVIPVRQGQMFDAVHELYQSKSKSKSKTQKPSPLTMVLAQQIELDRNRLYSEGVAKATLMTALFEYVHNVVFEMLRDQVAKKKTHNKTLANVSQSLQFPSSDITVMTYATARSIVPVKFNTRFMDYLRKMYEGVIGETDKLINRYVTVGANEVLADAMNSKIIKARQELLQLHLKYSRAEKKIADVVLAQWEFITHVDLFRSIIDKHIEDGCGYAKVNRKARVKGQIRSSRIREVVRDQIQMKGLPSNCTLIREQLIDYVSIKMEMEITKVRANPARNVGRRARGFAKLL